MHAIASRATRWPRAVIIIAAVAALGACAEEATAPTSYRPALHPTAPDTSTIALPSVEQFTTSVDLRAVGISG